MSRATPTYVDHNPIALAGADLTFRIVLTVMVILALIGFFIPSEVYDGEGSDRGQTGREIRSCTSTGASYSTCVNRVMGDSN